MMMVGVRCHGRCGVVIFFLDSWLMLIVAGCGKIHDATPSLLSNDMVANGWGEVQPTVFDAPGGRKQKETAQ